MIQQEVTTYGTPCLLLRKFRKPACIEKYPPYQKIGTFKRIDKIAFKSCADPQMSPITIQIVAWKSLLRYQSNRFFVDFAPTSIFLPFFNVRMKTQSLQKRRLPYGFQSFPFMILCSLYHPFCTFFCIKIVQTRSLCGF